jgi:hypothetical protein
VHAGQGRKAAAGLATRRSPAGRPAIPHWSSPFVEVDASRMLDASKSWSAIARRMLDDYATAR